MITLSLRHMSAGSNVAVNVMPQSHPTTDPVRFLSPVRFILCRCCSRGHIRLRAPYGLIWHGCILMVWLNNSQDPRVPRAVPVRVSYGPRTGIFNVSHILRDPYGARAWPARVPYGALTDTQGNWHNQNWQKSHTGDLFGRMGPYRPVRAPTGCSRAV